VRTVAIKLICAPSCVSRLCLAVCRRSAVRVEPWAGRG